MSEVDKFLDSYESNKNGGQKPASTSVKPASEVDALMQTAPPQDKGFLGHARDLGLSAVKSAIAVPEAVVGLSDIPTGGRVGKFLENEGGSFGFRPKEAKEILGEFHTDQYKEQQRQFQEADGVLDKTSVALQNPSLIANAVTESIAPMLAGGVAARGVMGATRLGQMGAKGAAAAGAIGEGTMMAGSQAEAIRQETDDGLLTPTQAGAAVATGALGTLFGYLGGRVAQRFGLGDIDTMIAQGAKPQIVAGEIAKLPAKSIPRQVVEGAISEGFLEELPQSISEQIIQNLALGKDWSEGVEDAAVMGALAGMAMGGGASLYNGMTRPEPQDGGLPPPAAGNEPRAAPPQGFAPTSERPVIDESALGRAGVFLPAPAPIINERALEPLPSQQMGLDHAAGPMSAAAALAVDTGASGAMQQAAQAVDPETGEILETGARVPEQKQATDTPEQMRERLGFIEQQARANGGWDRRTIEERDRLQAELAKIEPAADLSGAATEMVEPAPAIDVSGRTDEQLRVLEKAGRDGWREAAVAEIQRRAAQKPAGGQPAAQKLAAIQEFAKQVGSNVPAEEIAALPESEVVRLHNMLADARRLNAEVGSEWTQTAQNWIEGAVRSSIASQALGNRVEGMKERAKQFAEQSAAERAAREARNQPAAVPAPQADDARQALSAVPAVAIKDVIAKQIPDMSDAEIQQAIAHYGPDHKRTAKLQKEAQRRGQGAQAAAPVVAQAASAPAASTGGWDDMSAEQRAAVLTKPGGWATAKGGLNVIGKKLAGQNWTKINPATRATIERLMQGEQTTNVPERVEVAPQAQEAGGQEGEKAKWIKAAVDKSRLNGSSGVQLAVAPNGGVTFMGDPSTSKDGRALLANYEKALAAGATQQEIAAALQAQAERADTTQGRAQQGKQSDAPQDAPAPERDRRPMPSGLSFPSERIVTNVQGTFEALEVQASSIGTSDGYVNFGSQYPDGRYYIESAGKSIGFANGQWGDITPEGLKPRGTYDPDNLQAETIRVLEGEGAKRSKSAEPAQPPADAARPDEGATAQPEAPEFTTLKDRDGKTVTVRTADLSSDRERMPTFTKDGKRRTAWIHRDNLDPTGEKQAEGAKEMAGNPLFNVITTKDGGAFASEGAAERELRRRGLQDTHEVVPASEVSDGINGFVVRRTKAAAPAEAVEQQQPDAAAPAWRAVTSTPFADEAGAVLALMNAAQKPSQSEEVEKATRALARSAGESGDATARGVATFVADNALEALASHKINAGRGSVVEKARHKKLRDGIERLRSLEVERVTRGDETPAAVASQPTHKDPGQPAEPVTQPVIAEAIQKSARNTDFNPAEAKAWILGEIDKAIAGTPERNAELSAEMARVKASSFDYKEAEKKYGKNGARNKKAWDTEQDAFDRLKNDRIEKIARQIGYVMFDVPGDGKFKVVNTVEKLRDFRAKVEKSPGFANNPSRPMTYGSGMAGAVNLDAEIRRIEGLSAADRRYQGGDVLEEIGNAIEIARLKKSKDEGKLLDRFKEASKGKDYDAWRAEQETAEETAAREAAARQRAGQGDPQAFAQMMAMYDQPEDAAQQPEQPAKRYAGPSDVSSRDGQMELANRAGTIATLKAMNAQLRAIAPEEAWADANIEDAADLDALRNQISEALVRANRAGSAEQDSPLRKRLEEASGAELRAVFDALGLAGGARMIQADRVKALMSEDAQAVSDALDDVQSDGEPAAVEAPAQPPAANQPALTGPRRNPVQVSAFAPYAAGDIVALDGKDWQVQQDMGGWYLTSTGNWRGMHPTIQKIRGMNELIAEIERAATAQPAAAEQGVAPAEAEAEATAADLLTPDQARALMTWEDLGQRDNVKSMRLAFFESAESMAAKRGAMNYGTIESYQGGRWNIDGTTYPTLKAAKAAAVDAALVRLVNDGYVAPPFAAYDAVARTYGYEVRADGAIGSEGKFPGPTIKEKGGRLRVESSKGDLLGTYPAAPESLGRFLENFWGAEKQVAQPAAEQPASDSDQFTVERVVEDQRQTLTFKRGETVKVSGKYPMETGQIDGISNARKEFRIGGAWLPFGYAYKTEYDEFAAPRRELEEMIANAEKRIADGAGFQRDGYPIRDAREHAKRYSLEGYDDTLNDLAKRGQAAFDRSIAEDRARMAAAEQTDRERREAADAADAAKYAGPVKMTMDEWKRISRDFKSFNGGKRTVMQDGRIRRVEIVKEKAEAPDAEASAGYAAQHEALMASVRTGKATPEAFKASFEQVVANEDAIKAELSAKTKAELLRDGGPYLEMRYANEKKGSVVDAVYRQMIGEYALGESVTYGMARDSYQKAVRRMVEATDADKLAQYVRDREAAIQEAEVRRTARAEAMANPQTLNDYRSLMNAHIREGKTRHEAFLILTAEQRIRYDELEAEGTREAREARKRAAQNEVRAAGQTTGGQIIATKHTRDGYDLFVVQLAERLGREDYNTVLAGAKRLGGRYSAFRGNGAVPGFQFRTREDAEAFLKLAGGDVAAAKDQVEQRRDAFADDRSQSAVERLAEMADRMEQDADAEENRDRKANTARRARFASAALNAAAAQKATARTMRNIAQAIQGGKAKFLDAVRTRTQVDALLGYVRTAKDNELRAKYPSYAEQEKRRGEPATAETAGFAEFPSYTAFRSDLAMLGRQMLEIDGTKKLGQKLMSVADDVTDAYLEFARDNIRAVSQFGRGDALAEFASRDDAERAIRKSGLVGKAIVLPIKRGQNRVILSPSEAMSRKVWAGDGDKRITLSGEFGKELVEAIGRRGNKTNGLAVPWQFQNAYDRRKLLSRIGIETPSEFRSALREVIGLQETAVANKVREMELAMVGRRADGLDFFPTPAEIADQMVEAADITPDMAVLEPSAGMGHIADRIRAAGAEPDVIEISGERRELLEEKGYHLAEVNDFLNMEPRKFFTYGDIFRAPDGKQGILRGLGSMGSQRVRLDDEQGNRLGLYQRDEVVGVSHRGSWSGYDRIIMNPPFSDRRDAEHVQHAFTLLRPGGRIVAIMGEGVFFGQDKRAQDFRDWLDSVGGTSEKLPEGSFIDPSLPVQTGVNARMVVIDRPAVDGGDRQPGDADPEVAFSATFPRDRNALLTGITEKGLVRAMRLQFGGLSEVTQKMLERGRAGKRGGAVVINTADMREVGRIVAEKTGRDLDSTMRKFSTAGVVNGFYDPKSGLTFLVGPNLNPVTATAVLLHEVMHGQQRQKIDRRAMEMVRGRESMKDPAMRGFLDRVARRMAMAGESNKASEASAYIVEQAVIEGRSAGYKFADNAFVQWADKTLGKRVGDFLRSFLGMVRTWALRNGLGAKTMTVDDFVGYAMAGLDRAVEGDVRGASGAQIANSANVLGMSDRNRVASEQAPNPAGDGMTGGAIPLVTSPLPFAPHISVPVRVISDPSERFISFHIENGHAVMRAAPSLARDRDFIRARGFRAVQRFMWPFEDDVFVRTSSNPKDYEHIKNGTHRGSINHATKETEGGLSVASDISDAVGSYAYLVRGKVIGQGSDSEPLLETSTANVVSKRMSLGEMNKMISDGAKKKMQALGLTDQQQTALRVAVQYDFSRLNESNAPDGSGVRAARASNADEEGISFSRSSMEGAQALAKNIGDGLKSITVQDVKKAGKHKLTDWLKLGLQFLGRRQLVDVYGDVLPLAEYDRLAAQMEADKNDVGASADDLARRWGKLTDEGKLAELMHDATLAQIDADDTVEYAPGDDLIKSRMLKAQFAQLSPEAQKVYREARDHYRKHHAEVRQAITDRIMRSELREERRAELLKRMDDDFFKSIKGVYFPLARFGQYVVVTKDETGKVASVSRAETMAEAEAMRQEMVKAFPAKDGYQVGRVILSKEFIAGRDMVGRGFMSELFNALDEQQLDPRVMAELEDTLGQLYLSSLPDLSWAKHGIHRKGTPGFSQDARRAFAQNTFHGARYLAKLRYGDQMQAELDRMQKHVDEMSAIEDFDQPATQRVVDEMNKRHEAMMNPKSNPLSTALTSFGFVYYLGISPAAAVVNLSQTPLVAYPVLGAKWGFRKAGAALMTASKETMEGKNDLRSRLKNEDEIAAYDEAVRTGVIDVTMAHDLAGIAQGEDAKVMWKIRPVMRAASFLFHHAERFNRQATFLAAYRLARDAGAKHDTAYAQAVKATYDGHFDYSAGNRPRVMQGNVAKVVLLFKQYAQNMIYTIARNAYQSVKGESPEVRREARKVFGSLMTMHAAAAGVLGLPMVGTLLALASALGGSDDEPWDAEVALRNMLADAFGPKASEVIARGFSRLTPWDVSGRVGLDKLLLPDVNESLEGQRWAEAFATAMLGPVIGMGVNAAKGAQKMSDGDYARGLEDMLPIFARNPIKAYRQYSDGEVDRTGVVIKDEVSLAGVLGQASGFSPSEIRLAFEGRSAVMSADRRLNERRQDLMTQFARAAMEQDQSGMDEARSAIAEFNKVNPGRRITPPQLWQSVRNRQRRIREADDGVYLPRTRRDALEAGRFAEVG